MNINSLIISAFERAIVTDARIVAGGLLIAVGIVFTVIALRHRKSSVFTGQREWRATRGRAKVMTLSMHGATLFKSVNDKIEALRRKIDELTVEKAKIAAGLEGERAVSGFFTRHLNDEWTVIEGFKGAKGEIDFLLIGPLGVFAIEVKNRSGIVGCNGDHWTITKPDGSVEQLQDNGGRSPARQLNESAGWLASNLHHAGFSVQVPTAIIWAHPKASLGAITNMGVNYLILLGGNAPSHLRGYLALGTKLTQDQVGRVIMIVKSIHQKENL